MKDGTFLTEKDQEDKDMNDTERNNPERKENNEVDTNIEIPVYERFKGKQFSASGTWETTKGERRLIEGFGYLFFFGVFLGIIMIFIHPGKLAFIILALGIIGAIGTFVSLFAIVFKKHKEQPMETHYYDSDYKYNALTKEEVDNTKEITKEEFLGKK